MPFAPDSWIPSRSFTISSTTIPKTNFSPPCRETNVAVIARVPFEEGSLTGTLTAMSRWPAGDWRNNYFSGENLRNTLHRVDALKPLLRDGLTLPELALRFILTNPDVASTIPGMRKARNVEANLAASNRGPLSAELLGQLRHHRWDRVLSPAR